MLTRPAIRLGFGRFFPAVEGVSAGVMVGDARYGSTFSNHAQLFGPASVTGALGCPAFGQVVSAAGAQPAPPGRIQRRFPLSAHLSAFDRNFMRVDLRRAPL